MMELITKYEYSSLISARANQITFGSQPLVEYNEYDSAIDIATKEFDSKVFPLRIKRTDLNGSERILDPNKMKK